MARPTVKTDIGVRAPTTELGGILGGALTPAGMAPWSRWTDDQEFVPELIWPRSVAVYDKMATDSQMAALYTATVLGCLRFKWSIDPNGCDEEMVRHFSTDYNLPILGEPDPKQLRQKRRFAFKDHMRKALKGGKYGHYWFEQVGDIKPDGKWHLRKLAERPPHTIEHFNVADDGGLVSIVQNISRRRLDNTYWWGNLPEIPVDRLTGYVWDQEGANWAGRSWFRECYKNWLIKDRLLRIDAINHERAGGVPYIEAHPGATFDEITRLNEMAQGFRIGDTSGGAVPAGAKFNIAKGTNSSVVDSIRYHDEAMARRWMLMVMQLGQTETGSRALGGTFIEFWAWGLKSIAEWFMNTFNEHVIEDDVDWNWGDDVDQVPLLHYEYDPEFVVQDLATAVQAEVIVMDDELEAYVRKEMGVTEKGTPRLKQDAQVQLDLADKAAETAKEIAKQKPDPATQPGNQQPEAARAGSAEGAPSKSIPSATPPTDREE